jgi:hypothetical protein
MPTILLETASIYILRNSVGSLCYIGSTTLPLKKRFARHMSERIRNKKHQASHCSSFILFDRDPLGTTIELLEEYTWISKADLMKREKEFILQHPCCVNIYNVKRHH